MRYLYSMNQLLTLFFPILHIDRWKLTFVLILTILGVGSEFVLLVKISEVFHEISIQTDNASRNGGYLIIFLSVILLLTNLYLAFSIPRICFSAGDKLANKLVEKMLTFKDFGEILSDGEFSNIVALETIRISNGVLLPLIQLINRLVFILCSIIYVGYFFGWEVIYGFLILFSVLGVLVSFIKSTLVTYGRVVTSSQKHKLVKLREIYGLRFMRNFEKSFYPIIRLKDAQDNFSKAQSKIQLFQTSPRVLGDTFIYLIVSAVVLLNIDLKENVSATASIILLTIRALPILSQLVNIFIQIKTNMPAYENVIKTLELTNGGVCDVIKKPPDFIEVNWKITNSDDEKGRLINFKLYKNKINVITGPSGCGKSTLLRAISTGKVVNYNYDIEYVPPYSPVFEGTVQQNVDPNGRLDSITVLDALENACFRLSHKTKKASAHTLQMKIEEMGKNLSTGQIQRLIISRTLANGADVMLFDETLNGIDHAVAANIVANLKQVNSIIVIVSHDQKLIEHGDNLICL